MAPRTEAQKEKAREKAKAERQANRQARMKAERAAGRARGLKLGYAKGAIDVLSRFLTPEDRVIDCGANLGDITAPLAETGAQIVCFEPDPHCFERLQTRFADVSNVSLKNKAVYVENGTMSFSRHKAFGEKDFNTQAGTLVHGNKNVDYAPDAAIEVEVIDFTQWLADDIAANGPISVLKMDIEGAEVALLPAMLEAGLFDQIKLSLIETHENQFPELAADTAAIKAQISARYPANKVCLDWI